MSRTLWTSSDLKAVLELLADKVESDGVDAGVKRRHVDANVIHHQQETGRSEVSIRTTGKGREHRTMSSGDLTHRFLLGQSLCVL